MKHIVLPAISLLVSGLFAVAQTSPGAAPKTPGTTAPAKKVTKVSRPTLNPEGKQIWAKSFLNKKAPELVVGEWLTPEPNREGKFVLVDFWATWCGPCKQAIPDLNNLQKKYGDKLVVVGLSSESAQKVRSLKEPKIDYSLAIDQESRMNNEVDVSGIPHILLIDPKGIVRWEGNPLSSSRPFNEAVFQLMVKRYGKPATPTK